MKCHLTERWVEKLPTILLGLRVTFRPDLKATPCELVYGKTVRLRGEFFTASDDPVDESSFAKRLKEYTRSLRPTQTRLQTGQTFIPQDLSTCSHVFLRYDAVRASLRPIYDGPYLVLSKTEKVFRILKENKETVVSIDRLKPAFLLSGEPPQSNTPAADIEHQPPQSNTPAADIENQPPTKTCRSGRRVRTPVRFS
ncbi:uncharacterized protein [Parasteatoda tepidariorum]|uniref:uncharacterized protein n=1 Tax=Parasteatoda tepidariorum TaxID=114398 RepID=UPI00077FC720|nr:uncharacterized protein LOC107437187 [Parasteatoda tepidariorum]